VTFSGLAYLADAATNADVLRELADAYGRRVAALPPVALVIAAYNEEGAVGPVVQALPRTVCGLAAEVIVVADGCVDATAKEAEGAQPLLRRPVHPRRPAHLVARAPARLAGRHLRCHNHPGRGKVTMAAAAS
jgi:hypothetical protein